MKYIDSARVRKQMEKYFPSEREVSDDRYEWDLQKLDEDSWLDTDLLNAYKRCMLYNTHSGAPYDDLDDEEARDSFYHWLFQMELWLRRFYDRELAWTYFFQVREQTLGGIDCD